MIPRTPLIVAACLASIGLSLAARADQMPVELHATLDTAHEVPPVQGQGSGKMQGTLNRDTKELTYSVDYQGLSGQAAAAHFHGPADPGSNAGIVVPLQVSPSPIKGKATLTEQQMGDLMANKWYVNVHTQAHPAGEIRGQVSHAGP